MKISQETQTILKNFASINKGILLSPGDVLWTRTQSVYATAKIAEEFPKEVGIFDLANLLNVMSLFNDPEFEFEDNGLRISESDGRAETMYGYAGGSLVTLKRPEKMKPIPDGAISFNLPEEQWTKLQKATSIFQKPEIKIVSNGKVVRMGTANHKHEQGNSFSMVLDAEPNGVKCSMVYDKEHLPLLKGNYSGIITPTYTVLKNTSGFDLTYYIGVEPNTSSFGDDD